MDLSYIKELNEKAQELNLKRQKMLGAVEQNKERCAELLKQYNATYNTNITIDTVNAEYERVKADVTSAAEDLRKQIEYIESGEYKNAIKPEVKAESSVTAVGTDGQVIPDSNLEKVGYASPTGINIPNADTAEKTANLGGVSFGSISSLPASQSGSVSVPGGSVGVSSTGFGFGGTTPVNNSASAVSVGFGQPVPAPAPAVGFGQPKPAYTSGVGFGFGATPITSEPDVSAPPPANFGGMPKDATAANAQMNSILGNKFGGQ